VSKKAVLDMGNPPMSSTAFFGYFFLVTFVC